MHQIYFYKDKRGKEPVLDYIKALSSKTDKDSRIKANKIRDYMRYLKENGLGSKEPYVKRLDNEILELRPLQDRILFATWQDDSFIVLHHFIKKTQKTPRREIDKAKKNLRKYEELKKHGKK